LKYDDALYVMMMMIVYMMMMMTTDAGAIYEVVAMHVLSAVSHMLDRLDN